MIEASVFMTNRSQAVRLPAEVRFSENQKIIGSCIGQWSDFIASQPILG